jgi:hypothetical protein
LTFTTTKQLNRRQVRWSELLGQYKFKIIYTPRKDNGRADALSRRADLIQDKDVTEKLILQKNEDGSLGPKQEIALVLRIAAPDITKELKESYGEDSYATKLRKQQGNEILRY